ncbi:hypothetical protein MCEMSE6_01139 [Oxalobacteraceae bacterium]
MRDRAPRSYYLLALNWLLFFSVSLWISVAQGNLLWWLRLRWGSWLTELSAIGQLNALPAGSIWILWLIVSLILTAIDWFLPSKRASKQIQENDTSQGKTIVPNADLIDARPELKEKLLRLQQSLERI